MMRPPPALRRLACLAAALLSLAALGAQEGLGDWAPGPAGPTALPSYEAVVALARSLGEVPPRPLAYRLALRYGEPAASLLPGEAYRLSIQAERALRFGGTAQEAGILVRRLALLSLGQGPAGRGLGLLLREEERRGRLALGAFGGPERGAGRLGPGLAGLGWNPSGSSWPSSEGGPASGLPPSGSPVGGSGHSIGP